MEKRSRIKELFSEEMLNKIKDVTYSYFIEDPNKRADVILDLCRNLDMVELAPATNRLALLRDNYVFKFALDGRGIEDNLNEYDIAGDEGISKYITKTYETNGYILIAEYVNLITKNEFEASIPAIRNILKFLAENYIFTDVGTITKNFCNYGYRDNGDIVILDYGYMYRKDPKIMFCNVDGAPLVFDENYDKIICSKCGKSYHPLELMDKTKRDASEFKTPTKGAMVVRINKPLKKIFK